MSQTRSRSLIGLGLAALAICSAAGGAGAASLIGSKNIADDSIRSVDIQDGTISDRDVRDGSLTTADFGDDAPSGAPGPAGPTGSPGPTGPDGPTGGPGPGAVGPDQALTWFGGYTADGSDGTTGPLVISTQTLPASSLVRGVKLSATVDRTSCVNGMVLTLRPVGADVGDGQMASRHFYNQSDESLRLGEVVNS